MLKKIQKIAKEEPLWLASGLTIVCAILTGLNVVLIVAKIKGLV